MRLALEIYFGLMLLWIGYQLNDDIDVYNLRNYIKLVFSPVICLLWILWGLFNILYDKVVTIKNTLQLKFFWKHYVLKRQYDKAIIDDWNDTLKFKDTKSVAHRVWRLCVRLANERFNKQSNRNIH